MYVCPDCGESHADAGFCPFHGTELVERRDRLLGTTVGRYRLARRLGRGATGKVYLAVQPDIGSRVAIKVLSPHSAIDASMVRRFENEARAVNMIRHDNIIKVFDLTRVGDRPCIVMEYLDGSSLRQYVRDHSPIPIAAVARIMGQALDALDAAHARGIIHRDLKSENVYLTAKRRVKVLDFGMAKLREIDPNQPALTATGAILGTPDYLSPEQARCEPLDHRTDVYSAGVILFEAATGRVPFESESVFELLHMHVMQAPPSPRALRPEIPEAVERVILRALAKRPDDRFATVRDMDAALRRAVGLPPRRLRTAPPARPIERRERPTFSRKRGLGQMIYRDGQLHGYWTYWDDAGELVQVEEYVSGRLEKVIRYRGGHPA